MLAAVPTAEPKEQDLQPLLAQWRERVQLWQDAVCEPALSVLLAVQVVFVFVIGPLVSTGQLSRSVLEGFQLLMPLVSFFVLPRHSRVRLLVGLCLVPMLVLLIVETNELFGLALRMLTTLAITAVVAQAVFRVERVTLHQLLGAVVVYLNLALLFMGIFAGFDHALPHAFSTLTHQALKHGELLYFSLTTLTSTGYGDVLPVHLLVRSMANLEAVTGQLFLGTFLARMVSLHGRSGN